MSFSNRNHNPDRVPCHSNLPQSHRYTQLHLERVLNKYLFRFTRVILLLIMYNCSQIEYSQLNASEGLHAKKENPSPDPDPSVKNVSVTESLEVTKAG